VTLYKNEHPMRHDRVCISVPAREASVPPDTNRGVDVSTDLGSISIGIASRNLLMSLAGRRDDRRHIGCTTREGRS
jgi:hypothetical protein